MVGQWSGRRTADNNVQCKDLFSLQSFSEHTAERSSGGALRNVETLSVQTTRIPKLEKKLKEGKREGIVGR